MMKWELREPPAMQWRGSRSEKRKQQEREQKLKTFAKRVTQSSAYYVCVIVGICM